MVLGIQTSIMNNPLSFPFAKLFQGPELPASELVTHSEWKHLYSNLQLLSTPDGAVGTHTFFCSLLIYQWDPGVYLPKGFLKHYPFRPCQVAKWDRKRTKVAFEDPGAGLKSWHCWSVKRSEGTARLRWSIKVCGLSGKDQEYNSILTVDWHWAVCECIIGL